MTRKWLGVAVIVVALVFIVAFEAFRRSEADAPGWLYLVLLVFAPLGIWYDIAERRRKQDTSPPDT